jgi:hypothetical protein
MDSRRTGPCAHRITPIELTFTIPGPLLGYRASVARAHDPKYKAYKEAVRLYALAAGLAELPRDIDKCKHPQLSVFIRWRRKARIDWKNVVGAIEDALWAQDRDVDPGSFAVFRETGMPEEAKVIITWYVCPVGCNGIGRT